MKENAILINSVSIMVKKVIFQAKTYPKSIVGKHKKDNHTHAIIL
jgi:hypothetical protein